MYQHIEEMQRYLRDAKADAAFLRMPENMVLFTQYWPRYGFGFVLIPAQGKPWVICPEVEMPDAQVAGLDNLIPIGDVMLDDGDPTENTIAAVKKLAKELGIAPGATIAIEGGEDVMAPSFVSNKVQLCGDTTRRIIAEGFATSSFVMAKDAIRTLRRIKNASDIEKIAKVNRYLIKALDYFEEILQTPGIREIDVLMDTQAYFSKVSAEDCLASRAFGQLSTGAEKTYTAWADGIISDARVLEKGDLALYEVGAVMDGYWADLTRTGCVGGFTGRKKEMNDVVIAAFRAGVLASRDGATGHDVDKACRDVIDAAGYGKYFVTAAGHGTGFAHSEGYPVLQPGSTDVLRTNMTIEVEPGIYMPGVGAVRWEETVLVGPDGGVILGR